MGFRKSRCRSAIVIVIILLVAAGSLGWWLHQRLVPKRFAEVVPGRLYRSGVVTPRELTYVHEKYGIGRVISLLDPDHPESVAELAAADGLGIEWCNIPLRGNGASTPADRERILALLRVDGAPPTLVHCAAGTNRTGLAIGLYRIYVQGWTYEQVLEEMKRFGFEDLPKHENLREALRSAATQPTSRPAVEQEAGAKNRPAPPSGKHRSEEEDRGDIGWSGNQIASLAGKAAA